MSYCTDGCYCCGRVSAKDKMDVDAALQELGMLSAVTNSRKEFLHERHRSISEPSSGGFREPMPGGSRMNSKGYQIVKCDPKYVTAFSAELPNPITESQTMTSNYMATPKIPSCSQTEAVLDPNARDCHPILQRHKGVPRRSLMRRDRYKRYLKPYEVPWRHNSSLPEAEMRKEDNLESKSTNSSPVKALSDGPLTRSRSLNNLEAARTKLADIFEESLFLGGAQVSARQVEIDGVSQRIENFHIVERPPEIERVSLGIESIHFSPDKKKDIDEMSNRITNLQFQPNI